MLSIHVMENDDEFKKSFCLQKVCFHHLFMGFCKCVEIISMCLLNFLLLQCSLEGYERLALARGEGMCISEARGDYDFSTEKDLSFGVTDHCATSSMLSEMDVGTSIPNASTAEISGNVGDAYDMFGDDEDNAIAVASSDISNLVPGTESNVAYQPSSDGLNAISGSKLL